MKKKLISLVLSVCLALTTCPLALADTTGSSFKNPIVASVGTKYSNTFTVTDTDWYYQFTLSKDGTLTLAGTSYMRSIRFYLYSSDGTELSDESFYWNSNTEEAAVSCEYTLLAGTYILYVDSSYYGSFNFKTTFSAATESFPETVSSDNTLATANSIKLNQKYSGQIALNDKLDFYKFKLTKSSALNLYIINYVRYGLYWTIYNTDGEKVDRLYGSSTNSLTGVVKEYKSTTLSAGTYYLCVECEVSGSDDSDWYGNYTFALYNDSGVKKPAQTSCSLKKSKTKMTVSWKKVSNAKGYQIMISRDKSFGTWYTTTYTIKKGSKTSVKITGLTKGRKYYVKVRAYNTGYGFTKYGKWSKAKSVKIS